MKRIGALLLDVDGVIVGGRQGFNWPMPHPDVLGRLKALRKRNIPIILCTVKPHHTIEAIVRQAGLDNYHVTDSGALIINPVTRSVLQKHTVADKPLQSLLRLCEDTGLFTEVYTQDERFIREGADRSLIHNREAILLRPARQVASLSKTAAVHEIIRINIITRDDAEARTFLAGFSVFERDLSLIWSIHPLAPGMQTGVITARGVSKKQSAGVALQKSNATFAETLGVGDSASDWIFMEPCGGAAAMGNAMDELKTLVKTKGGSGFIGGPVNDNGLLGILDYFRVGSV